MLNFNIHDSVSCVFDSVSCLETINGQNTAHHHNHHYKWVIFILIVA